MTVDACSLKGRRPRNEDSYLVAEGECGRMRVDLFHHDAADGYEFSANLPDGTLLLVVADGVGGAPNGEDASFIASTHFLDNLDGAWGDGLDARGAILSAARRTSDEVSMAYPGSASTIVGLLFVGNRCWAFNAGDSRCVADDNGDVFVTRDHVLEEGSNAITSYMGAQDPDVRIHEFPIPPSRAVLFSDGLQPCLPASARSILDYPGTASSLCSEALESGSTDNITCIIYRE
jgi:serine/threonine protein phosphatase PrpC